MAQNVVPVTMGSPQFHRRDVGSLRVTEALFPPRAELSLHAHERPVLAVILDGSWDEIIGGRVHECQPGSVQIEPAEEKHTNRFHDAGARVLVVEPDPSRTELFDPCAELLRDAACFHDWGVGALARRVVSEIANPDDLSGLAIEGLTMELLVHAVRNQSRRGRRRDTPVWFARVRERLHEEFRRSPRLADLADTAGVHPMHLARTFRRHTGMSIGAYLRRLRLDWSADQLTNAETTLAEIAVRAGFSDQSHFTRAFRRYTGLTPRSYRAARNGRATGCRTSEWS
jgi:AraC family transcriptional regulator